MLADYESPYTAEGLKKSLDEAIAEIERLQWELEIAVKWRDNYKLAWERATGKTNE